MKSFLKNIWRNLLALSGIVISVLILILKRNKRKLKKANHEIRVKDTIESIRERQRKAKDDILADEERRIEEKHSDKPYTASDINKL